MTDPAGDAARAQGRIAWASSCLAWLALAPVLLFVAGAVVVVLVIALR